MFIDRSVSPVHVIFGLGKTVGVVATIYIVVATASKKLSRISVALLSLKMNISRDWYRCFDGCIIVSLPHFTLLVVVRS